MYMYYMYITHYIHNNAKLLKVNKLKNQINNK